MRRPLRLHPDQPCCAATHIDVEVARSGAGLLVRYAVTGRIGELRIPPVTSAIRAQELWQTTCFEAFIRPSVEDGYYEFNFAPSTQWAAYRFDAYRSGMRDVADFTAPRIDVQSSAESFTLQASLALDRLPGLPRDVPWRLGLSALIEERSGRHSHWALAHPPGKADFHHSVCFAYEISPA